MKSRDGLALALLAHATQTLAQYVTTVTVSVNTNPSCTPVSGIGSSGGSGGGAGGAGGLSGSGSGSGSGNGGSNGSGPSVAPVDTATGRYTALGYYPAPADGKTLDGPVFTDPSLTAERCGIDCQGYSYFALYNGDQCNCGSSAPSGTGVSAPPTGAPGSYALVYQRTSDLEGSSVVVESTTNSAGSVVVASFTSYFPISSGAVVPYTSTGTDGSVIVATSTVSGSGSSGSGSSGSGSGTGSGSGSSGSGSGGSSNSGTGTTSSSTGTSTGPSSSTYPCPGLDGSTYTDNSDSTYNIKCATDLNGNDLQDIHADTFEQCLELCDSYQPVPTALVGDGPCVGVTWQPINPGNNCFRKYQITEIVIGDGGLDSAYYSNYTLPNNVVTSTTTIGGSGNTATAASGGNNGNSATATNGGSGGATTTAASGGNNGASGAGNGGNGGSTASGGGTPTANGGATNSEPTSTTAPSCVSGQNYAGNNTYYVDKLGYTYDIRCNENLQSQPTDNDAYADTFEDCLQYCSLLKGCVAVNYQDPPYHPGFNLSSCFPKWNFGGYKNSNPPTDGVYSGVLVNGPSPGFDEQNLCTADNDQGSSYDGLEWYDDYDTAWNIGCDNLINIDSAAALFTTVTDTLADCVDYCSAYDTCVMVNWLGPHTNGTLNDANCFPAKAIGTPGNPGSSPGLGYATLPT